MEELLKEENSKDKTSRYERKRMEREEKDRERDAVMRKKKLRGYAVWAIVLVVVVGGIAQLVRSSNRKAEVVQTALRGEKIEDKGRNHSEAIDPESFNSLPPTSGTHFSSQTNWGIHKEPVPEGYQVHNLEHGGILIQYRPDLDQETQDKLKAVGEAYGWKKLILAPYPALEEKNDKQIALTAWTYLDKFDGFDEARIRAFIDAYRNHGPENVPDNMQSVTLP